MAAQAKYVEIGLIKHGTTDCCDCSNDLCFCENDVRQQMSTEALPPIANKTTGYSTELSSKSAFSKISKIDTFVSVNISVRS